MSLGSFTLYDMLESEYRNYLPRVMCTLIDEEQIIDPDQLQIMLQTTLPEEVERIEFMFFDRLLMLRIYTRKFMQDMFDRALELHAPTLFPQGNSPPLCL